MCAETHMSAEVKVRKNGKRPVNLAINAGVAKAAEVFVTANRRKGRSSLSELTENLWITYLRKQGIKLPPLLKADR
jgi:hypothetical protein